MAPGEVAEETKASGACAVATLASVDEEDGREAVRGPSTASSRRVAPGEFATAGLGRSPGGTPRSMLAKARSVGAGLNEGLREKTATAKTKLEQGFTKTGALVRAGVATAANSAASAASDAGIDVVRRSPSGRERSLSGMAASSARTTDWDEDRPASTRHLGSASVRGSRRGGGAAGGKSKVGTPGGLMVTSYSRAQTEKTVEFPHQRGARLPVFAPHAAWRLWWDASMLLATGFVVLVTPFELTFLSEDATGCAPHRNGLDLANFVVNIFFICDMALCVNTSYFSPLDGTWVVERGSIVARYLGTWSAFRRGDDGLPWRARSFREREARNKDASAGTAWGYVDREGRFKRKKGPASFDGVPL